MVVQTRKRRRPTAKVDSAAQGEEIEGDGAPRGETAGGAGVPEALALVEGTAPQAEGTPPQAEGTPPEPKPEPRPEDDANYSEKAHMKFLELWRSALPHFQGTEEQRAMISDEEHLYKLSLEVTIALGKEYTPPKNTNDKVRKQLTKQYMKRLRSFNHNFNIENNPDLTFEVLLGDITPEQLCTMDPSEYAPKDLREENARLREESMKRRVLDAETAATFSTAAAVTAAVENKVEVLGKSNVTKDEVLDLEMKVERKISASKEEGEERLDAMADELFNASPKRARASPPAKSSPQAKQRQPSSPSGSGDSLPSADANIEEIVNTALTPQEREELPRQKPSPTTVRVTAAHEDQIWDLPRSAQREGTTWSGGLSGNMEYGSEFVKCDCTAEYLSGELDLHSNLPDVPNEDEVHLVIQKTIKMEKGVEYLKQLLGLDHKRKKICFALLCAAEPKDVTNMSALVKHFSGENTLGVYTYPERPKDGKYSQEIYFIPPSPVARKILKGKANQGESFVIAMISHRDVRRQQKQHKRRPKPVLDAYTAAPDPSATSSPKSGGSPAERDGESRSRSLPAGYVRDAYGNVTPAPKPSAYAAAAASGQGTYDRYRQGHSAAATAAHHQQYHQQYHQYYQQQQQQQHSSQYYAAGASYRRQGSYQDDYYAARGGSHQHQHQRASGYTHQHQEAAYGRDSRYTHQHQEAAYGRGSGYTHQHQEAAYGRGSGYTHQRQEAAYGRGSGYTHQRQEAAYGRGAGNGYGSAGYERGGGGYYRGEDYGSGGRGGDGGRYPSQRDHGKHSGGQDGRYQQQQQRWDRNGAGSGGGRGGQQHHQHQNFQRRDRHQSYR